MRWLGNLALGLALVCLAHLDAWAAKRVALVIGNGAYAHAPHLPNPERDASDVAAALKRLDFDVIVGTHLGQAGMQDAVIRFARAAQSADVAIFYYSGHAVQFNSVNYLMPVDATLDDEADLYRFTRVDDVLGYLQQAKALKVLVLDSCRDNPLADTLKRSAGLTRGASLQRGLARIEAPVGTIVSYSTQAGQTAIDGKGPNSPFTTAFLKHIEEPAEIGDIFREISADVYRATGQTQLPELSLSIIGKFYLKGPISLGVNPPARPPPADPCAAAGDHWKSAEAVASLAAFEDHLALFSTCAFAGLARARIAALKSKTAAVVRPVGPARPLPADEAAPIAAMNPALTVGRCDVAAVGALLPSRTAKPLTAAEECSLKPRDIFKECEKCPEMVVVPAGSFMTSANDPELIPITGPPRQVTLARPFAVGRFHITLAQFAAFVEETGYDAGACTPGESWRNPGFPQSGNHPVVCVSWADAKAYAVWLSTKSGKIYRLLTEAEWEYAARAGTTTKWFWGNKEADAKAYAHCADCSMKSPHATAPVGSFKPNTFALFDMAGNAYQLVQDCYQPGFAGASLEGLAGTGTCPLHVVRGGSWNKPLDWASSASRFLETPMMRSNEIGFRVARALRL